MVVHPEQLALPVASQARVAVELDELSTAVEHDVLIDSFKLCVTNNVM